METEIVRVNLGFARVQEDYENRLPIDGENRTFLNPDNFSPIKEIILRFDATMLDQPPYLEKEVHDLLRQELHRVLDEQVSAIIMLRKAFK